MSERKGILLVLATAIISGVSVYVNSIAVKFSNPFVFTGIKNAIVGIVFLSLIILFKEWKKIKELSKKQWIRLMTIGLIGGSVPFLLFFKGLTITTAAKGGFIQKTMFLYVALLAIAFLKEKMNKSFFIGLGALLFGNILFLGIKPQALNWGDGLIFIATLLWAVEIIISKKALADLPVNIVAWGRMFFGAIFIGLFLVNTHQLAPLFAYNTVQWKWIAITSVFLVGYVFTLYHGLKSVRASVATAVLAIGAPITSLITIIAQGNVNWGAGKSWGVVLMMAGIVLVIGLNQLKNVLRLRHAQAS
jgi:drug/metabolite transporter (DMT)-like permease